MDKFFGKVGFAQTVETRPGVWKEQVTVNEYYGDVLKNARRLQSSQNLNDDLAVSVDISIVADPFANENFHAIRYVEWMNSKWKVTNVSVAYPRLILSLGGVYNE